MKKDRRTAFFNLQPPAIHRRGPMAFAIVILLTVLLVSCSPEQRSRQQTSSSITSPQASSSTTTLQASQPQAIQPLGTRPAHLDNPPVSIVPNQQAIKAALWAPGIDHGYVPQGLTFAEGHVLVSAYFSTSPAVSMGACRVYRIDPESGKITGYFDLPPACGHAGGLAYAGNGVLILSDTRRLYRINLEQALQDRHANNAITGTLKLGGSLRGSFVTYVPVTYVPVTYVPVTYVPAAFVPATAQPDTQPDTQPDAQPGLFIGAWSTFRSKGHFLPLSLFDSHDGTIITEENATGSLALGARAQGASFAPDGSLWLSYSNQHFGRVDAVDSTTGKVLASYPLASGTEDLGFDDQGGLWAVSEAGSLRWRSWKTSFPVVFRLDTSLLE